MHNVPLVFLAPYVLDPSSVESMTACRRMADALSGFGVVRVKLPSYDVARAARLRARTLDFYRLPPEEKAKLDRPETGRNLGWSPPFIETPGMREAIRQQLASEHAAVPWTGQDPKERYMIPVGPAPLVTAYPAYNLKQAICPPGFEDWIAESLVWAEFALDVAFVIIEMTTLGLGIGDKDFFTRKLRGGPHQFGPTGCDLSLLTKLWMQIAGFHSDMSFGTIHGQSNCRGLRAWTRQFERFDVCMEADELLFQAGKQFEISTGGVILAGFHEVAVLEATLRYIEAELAAGRVPWRVSLTEFIHIASDEMLEPMGRFDTPEARERYADNILLAGDRMSRQLRKRGLDVPVIG